MKISLVINKLYPENILYHYNTFKKFISTWLINKGTKEELNALILLLNSLTIISHGEDTSHNESNNSDNAKYYKGFIVFPMNLCRTDKSFEITNKGDLERIYSLEDINSEDLNISFIESVFPKFCRFINPLDLKTESYLTIKYNSNTIKLFLFDWSPRKEKYYNTKIKSLPSYVKLTGTWEISSSSNTFTVDKISELRLFLTDLNFGIRNILTTTTYLSSLINLTNNNITKFLSYILNILKYPNNYSATRISDEVNLDPLDFSEDVKDNNVKWYLAATNLFLDGLVKTLEFEPLTINDITTIRGINNKIGSLLTLLKQFVKNRIGVKDPFTKDYRNIINYNFLLLWDNSSFEEQTVLYFIIACDYERRYEYYNPGTGKKLTFADLTKEEVLSDLLEIYNISIRPYGVNSNTTGANIMIRDSIDAENALKTMQALPHISRGFIFQIFDDINYSDGITNICSDFSLNNRYILGLDYRKSYNLFLNYIYLFIQDLVSDGEGLANNVFRLLNIFRFIAYWVHSSWEEKTVLVYLLSNNMYELEKQLTSLGSNTAYLNTTMVFNQGSNELFLTYEYLENYKHPGSSNTLEPSIRDYSNQLEYVLDKYVKYLCGSPSACTAEQKDKYLNLDRVCYEWKIDKYYEKKYNYVYNINEFKDIITFYIDEV